MKISLTPLLLVTVLLPAGALAASLSATSASSTTNMVSADDSGAAMVRKLTVSQSLLSVDRLGFSYKTAEAQAGDSMNQILPDGSRLRPQSVESRVIFGATAVPVIKGDQKDAFAYLPSVTFKFDFGPIHRS